MGKCLNHPDRDTGLQCSKDDVFFCDECIECHSKTIYCKYRTQCPIWYVLRERGDAVDAPAEPGDGDEIDACPRKS